MLFELGLIMSLPDHEMRCLLLRSRDDPKEAPFDIAGFPVLTYRHKGSDNSLEIWRPGSEQSNSFEEILNAFLDQLQGDPSFRAAKPYRG